MSAWVCMFCGNEVEEHGLGSLCCGEVNHTEQVEDEDDEAGTEEITS